jgi:hypothetical protein
MGGKEDDFFLTTFTRDYDELASEFTKKKEVSHKPAKKQQKSAEEISFSAKHIDPTFFSLPPPPPPITSAMPLIKYSTSKHSEVVGLTAKLLQNKAFKEGVQESPEELYSLLQDCIATILEHGRSARQKKTKKPAKLSSEAMKKKTQKIHQEMDQSKKRGRGVEAEEEDDDDDECEIVG